MLHNRGFSWRHCWDAKCHILYQRADRKNVAPMCYFSCSLQHTFLTLMGCSLRSVPKNLKKQTLFFLKFYFQMSWPTFLGVFLFPNPNSFINLPGKTNVCKVTNENKDVGNGSSWIYSVYKVAGIAKKYSVFHRLKSFDMLKCVFGGGPAVRVYTIFCLLFALGSKRAEHTCAFWLSFFFFFSPLLFKMCLMTAMRACCNAFAALQWNTEPAKVVAKPRCASALTGISHRPIISIRQAEWLQLHLPKC